jgi:hypothetical protein
MRLPRCRRSAARADRPRGAGHRERRHAAPFADRRPEGWDVTIYRVHLAPARLRVTAQRAFPWALRRLARRLRHLVAMHRHSILLEGVLVGLAGATAVALWFLIVDLAVGVPFRTPALLAAALFEGVRDVDAVTVTAGRVLKYTVVHGIAFIAFGLFVAGLFALVDRDRRVLFFVFMLFCCFEVAFLFVVMVLFEWLLKDMSPWLVLTGNALATAVMLAILFRRHRKSPVELLATGK